jgi:hypothetical protein
MLLRPRRRSSLFLPPLSLLPLSLLPLRRNPSILSLFLSVFLIISRKFP